MKNQITMPKLSDTMEEGKILRWLKHPGDPIRRGEPIAEVETDKADMVLEAFDEGVLDEIKLKEGESAPVGEVIALLKPTEEVTKFPVVSAQASIESALADNRPEEAPQLAPKPIPGARPERSQRRAFAEHAASAPPIDVNDTAIDRYTHPAMSANPSAAPTAIVAPPATAVGPETQAPHDAATVANGLKFRASPLARRAAEEAGLDVSRVHGTGPEGRVTKRDVDNFLREQQLFKFRRLIAPREGALGSREELSKMRKTIAQRMALSKREIPHFYVTIEVDMEEVVRLKKSLEVTKIFEETITFNDIIVKACALALGRYPRINASFAADGIVIHPNINIGVAVAVEEGLLLPVIHECERLSLPEIARATHRLVAKASRGGFAGDELSGATFSISNMGMLGIEHFSAVIVPPQAAILAVSAIKERPVVRNGQLAVATTMMITVSCDHRIIDGVVAGRFLQELKRFLENPASLLV
jgi:pyruvate dehydrogenase E2 component (dihydrolipoamide acetyltransferase)